MTSQHTDSQYCVFFLHLSFYTYFPSRPMTLLRRRTLAWRENTILSRARWLLNIDTDPYRGLSGILLVQRFHARTTSYTNI